MGKMRIGGEMPVERISSGLKATSLFNERTNITAIELFWSIARHPSESDSIHIWISTI